MLKYQQGRRKYLPILFLIFFAALVLSSCSFKEQSNLTSPLALENSHIWDFGQVKEGSSLEHSFILKNFKDEPLTITSVHTSCGCTVSQTQKKHLLPQEYTLIDVKFNTQGYSGQVQQHVYVHTDDVEESIIKFSVKAEVVK